MRPYFLLFPISILPEWPIHSCPHHASSEVAYVSWVILYIWWFSGSSAEIRCFLASITQETYFHALYSILCGHSIVPFSYSVSLDQLASPLAIVYESVHPHPTFLSTKFYNHMHHLKLFWGVREVFISSVKVTLKFGYNESTVCSQLTFTYWTLVVLFLFFPFLTLIL